MIYYLYKQYLSEFIKKTVEKMANSLRKSKKVNHFNGKLIYTNECTKCYNQIKERDCLLERRLLEMANYSAAQIAKWFLARNNVEMAENGAEYITNLKLQKLLYYAQGTYIAITGNKLFKDPIVAWKHGPVVENVYYAYRDNGSNGIEFNEDFDANTIDTETKGILEQVYENFGQFSAWKLREMTHNERPWQETNQSEEIDLNTIKDFFLEEYIEQ